MQVKTIKDTSHSYHEDAIYTSSRIVRVAAATGLAQEFRRAKVKIKNSTSSVYSRLYDTSHFIDKFIDVLTLTISISISQ